MCSIYPYQLSPTELKAKLVYRKQMHMKRLKQLSDLQGWHIFIIKRAIENVKSMRRHL